MSNEIDRLLSMGRKAYEDGLTLVNEFEKENPAFSRSLGQPLTAQFRAELLSLLLYLCEADGQMTTRKANYINTVLGYGYSDADYTELMKRLKLHEQNFGSLIPTVLKAAVQYDSARGNHKAAQAIIRIMDRIAESCRLYAMPNSAMPDMDQRIYILTLTNWLQDNGSKPFQSSVLVQNMPEIPEIEDMETGTGAAEKPAVPEKSVEELMAELNGLTGLKQVKEDVNSLINLLKIKKLRKERNMNAIDVSMHLVFTGNPGTGKTTVARLLAQIYHALGALSKGQLVEVDRSELVGGYVGQTAIKTQEVTDSALGGVLFIDEAYSLTSGKDSSDFGYEAVNTLLVEMENHRDDLAVIVAGYPELMEKFLSSNPGLKSRFNKFIEFPDYNPEELMEIFVSMAEKNGYTLDDKARETAKKLLEDKYYERDENFANGREVRNFFEKAMVRQANRLAVQEKITDEELAALTSEDLMEPENQKDQEEKADTAPEKEEQNAEK
ncbi:MAG: AAA family ATPase [Erysipelotrichaceae bacterium]|nr:AAA family ATPase [Erysipelotrichaceae bacterium]